MNYSGLTCIRIMAICAESVMMTATWARTASATVVWETQLVDSGLV
jgi:hypothetical protein